MLGAIRSGRPVLEIALLSILLGSVLLALAVQLLMGVECVDDDDDSTGQDDDDAGDEPCLPSTTVFFEGAGVPAQSLCGSAGHVGHAGRHGGGAVPGRGAATQVDLPLVSNGGPGDLELNLVSLSSPVNATGSVISPTVPTTVPSGSDFTPTIDVTPAGGGPWSFDVTLDTNDPTTPLFGYAFEGDVGVPTVGLVDQNGATVNAGGTVRFPSASSPCLGRR
jgi:hypothetical protein